MSSLVKAKVTAAVVMACACLYCCQSAGGNKSTQGQTADGCSQQVDSWQWRDPLPSGNNLWDIAYGACQFVAVADGGVIFTSPDGKAWTRSTLCTFNNFCSIVYGAGQFVAVGDSGTIFTSKDACSWHSRNSGALTRLNAVIYGNDRFLAVGEDATICVSTDAVSWKLCRQWEKLSELQVREDFRDLAFGAGTFAVITYPGHIFTSIDGLTWNKQNSGNIKEGEEIYLNYLFYANNTFMATGYKHTGENNPRILLASTDGKAWAPQEQQLADYNLRFTVNAGDRCLAFGDIEKEYRKTTAAAVLNASGAIAWTPVVLKGDTVRYFSHCVYGAGTYVGVGGGNGIYTSTDGITWTKRAEEKSSLGRTLLRSVAYGNGRFVAVCTRGGVFTSPDGVSWTKGNSGSKEDLTTVLYKSDRFAAISEEGAVLTSVDAITWRFVNRYESGQFMPVIRASGKYVAVGGFGTVLTSPDAVSWTVAGPATKQRLVSAAYGAGQFVAVGEKGTIISSSDGITWAGRSTGTTQDINAIAYAAGRFIAVGFYGIMLTSTDGITWTREISGTTNFFHSITWGANQFVAVGTHGILSSRTGKDTTHNSPDDTIVGLWPSSDYTSYQIASINPRGEGSPTEPMVPANIRTFSYPELPAYGKSIDDFTPAGWEVLASDSGDLDNNKSTDIAVVLQHSDSIPVDGALTQPRVLAIVFKDSKNNRYNLIEQSNTFILKHDNQGMDDPFTGISIEKGILQISFSLFYNMGSWSMTGAVYKFRYQGKEFVLIGADKNVYMRNTGNSEDYSYNFLSKKRRLIKGNGSEDSEVKDDTAWSTVEIDELKTLKTFEAPFSWEVDGEGSL
jgi:hypothetical protein